MLGVGATMIGTPELMARKDKAERKPVRRPDGVGNQKGPALRSWCAVQNLVG